MEYKIISKRIKPNPKKNQNIYIFISLLYIKETRLQEHGFVFMIFYKDLKDVLETCEFKKKCS